MSLVLVCNHTNFASANKKVETGVYDVANVGIEGDIDL